MFWFKHCQYTYYAKLKQILKWDRNYTNFKRLHVSTKNSFHKFEGETWMLGWMLILNGLTEWNLESFFLKIVSKFLVVRKSYAKRKNLLTYEMWTQFSFCTENLSLYVTGNRIHSPQNLVESTNTAFIIVWFNLCIIDNRGKTNEKSKSNSLPFGFWLRIERTLKLRFKSNNESKPEHSIEYWLYKYVEKRCK